MLTMLQSDSIRTVQAAIHGLAHLMVGADDALARDALVAYQAQLEDHLDPLLREEIDRAMSGRVL